MRLVFNFFASKMTHLFKFWFIRIFLLITKPKPALTFVNWTKTDILKLSTSHHNSVISRYFWNYLWICAPFWRKFDHCGMWIWWFMFNFFHEKRKLCSLPLKRKGLTIIFQLKFTSTTLPLHKEQNNFHKWQILTLYFSLKIHILKSTFY